MVPCTETRALANMTNTLAGDIHAVNTKLRGLYLRQSIISKWQRWRYKVTTGFITECKLLINIEDHSSHYGLPRLAIVQLFTIQLKYCFSVKVIFYFYWYFFLNVAKVMFSCGSFHVNSNSCENCPPTWHPQIFLIFGTLKVNLMEKSKISRLTWKYFQSYVPMKKVAWP